MRYDELTDRISSGRAVKIYMVDHSNLALLTGYATKPRKTSAARIVSLEPWVGILQLGEAHMNYPVSGKGTDFPGDSRNNGVLFYGRFATTDFYEHKRQAILFIRQIIESGEDPANLQQYFKLARELKI